MSRGLIFTLVSLCLSLAVEVREGTKLTRAVVRGQLWLEGFQAAE